MAWATTAWRKRHLSLDRKDSASDKIVCYPESKDDAQRILNRRNLSDDDIASLCRGGELPANDAPVGGDDVRTSREPNGKAVDRFKRRRSEIRVLAADLADGDANFDQDGRIIRLDQLERDQQEQQQREPQANQQQGLIPILIAHLENMEGNAPRNNQDEERRVAAERQEAAEAIARAIERYRAEDVPHDELELVPIEPQAPVADNLTFRRIFIAVSAVTAAFVCVLLQILDPLEAFEVSDPSFDPLMKDLLEFRPYWKHEKYCPGLHRQAPDSWRLRISELFGLEKDFRCDSGVLWIPSTENLAPSMIEIPPDMPSESLSSKGFNVSWDVPCQARDSYLNDSCLVSHNSKTCKASFVRGNRCFRGVHDFTSISESDINGALKLGARMISNGGDHYDVHDDVSSLNWHVSGVLRKLKRLLQDTYGIQTPSPKSFRVFTSAAMDARRLSWKLPVAATINQTNFNSWVRSSRRHNNNVLQRSSFSRSRHVPKRDTCKLIADLDIDPRYQILTAVYLTSGGGKDYIGGTSIYVDDYHTRKRVRRGLAVDGSAGRVVVSSGETRRCHLPLRAGVRSILQIWWSMVD